MTEPTDEAPEAEPQARRRLLLARLAEAVRRQDWFTVLVEIAVVVLGVVIGFQVTAWGQGQSDRAKEQTYLRQLLTDLRETERALDEADSGLLDTERAANLVHRAFYTPERPPRDSLRVWMGRSGGARTVRPVLGTVEALVATGDLALVRDDSLRSALLDYLEASRAELDVLLILHEMIGEANREIYRRVDLPSLFVDAYPADVIESFVGPPETTAFFAGPRRDPFPFSVEAVLTDPDLAAAVNQLTLVNQNLRRVRQRMREDAQALRAAVEATFDE